MKIKSKGKVHPSSSDSSSSSSQSPTHSDKEKQKNVSSILNLLPATILTLISVLSLHDQEVLAYMVTHSLKTTLIEDSKKKPSSSSSSNKVTHKTCPSFDCGCFDCYTSYWQRWNNSPNHQVIQQAIEEFDDHLSKDEKPKDEEPKDEKPKKSNNRSRKSKNSRKPAAKLVLGGNKGNLEKKSLDTPISKNQESSSLEHVNVPSSNEVAQGGVLKSGGEIEELSADVEAVKEDIQFAGRSPGVVNHRKGIARKLLPDVLGILNSRLWNLWRPKV